MNLKNVSLFITLFQNTFLWIGIVGLAFHLVVLNTQLGSMLFTPSWLITVRNINSCIMWGMVLLGGKESIKLHTKFKKGVDSIREGEE